MGTLAEFAGDVVSRFDPNDPVNLTLFFGWIFVFTVTFAGIWRAGRRWVRLLCYIVNQVVSFGMLQAGALTFAILLGYWRETIAAAGLTLLASCWLFGERRSRTWRRRERRMDNSLTSPRGLPS